jgi:hypothetical protein
MSFLRKYPSARELPIASPSGFLCDRMTTSFGEESSAFICCISVIDVIKCENDK